MSLEETIEAIIGLIIILILIDAFFLGWFVLDQPILETVREGLPAGILLASIGGVLH